MRSRFETSGSRSRTRSADRGRARREPRAARRHGQPLALRSPPRAATRVRRRGRSTGTGRTAQRKRLERSRTVRHSPVRLLPEVGDLRKQGRRDEPDETHDQRQRREIQERHRDRPWHAKRLETLRRPGEGGREENADEQDQQHVLEPHQGEKSDCRKEGRATTRRRAAERAAAAIPACREGSSWTAPRSATHRSTASCLRPAPSSRRSQALRSSRS